MRGVRRWVKLSTVDPVDSITALGRIQVLLHSNLTSTKERGERSAPPYICFGFRRKDPLIGVEYEAGWTPAGMDDLEKKSLSCAENQATVARWLCSEPSHFTD
jgi:hypothetical protein